MSTEEDLLCNISKDSVLSAESFKLPDPHSITPDTINEYTKKLDIAINLYGDEGAVLYEPDEASLLSASRSAQDEYFRLLGEERFTGLDLKEFIYTRYLVLTGTDQTPDIINYNTPEIITLCDEEGYPYTVTVPLSTRFTDSNKSIITFPLFDSRGTQITLPLVDSRGKFVLTESVTAIDAKKKLIYFPLKNIKNEYIKYPVRDINGSIVTVPIKNNPNILSNVSAARVEFNSLYEFSKDKHAHSFVDYLINIQKTNKLSIFHGDIKLGSTAQLPSMKYFIVGVYPITATNSQLIDIESTSMMYYARYYVDRIDFVKDKFADRDGKAMINIYDVDFSDTDTTTIQAYGKDLSILSILNAPFWSLGNIAETEKNKITKSVFATQISSMQQSINNLTAAVAALQSGAS